MDQQVIERAADVALANAAKRAVREAAMAEAALSLKEADKSEKARAAAEAKARDKAAAERSAGLKAFTAALAGWMVFHNCDNPREVPDEVVNSLRSAANL